MCAGKQSKFEVADVSLLKYASKNKREKGEFLDISTDSETPNKQETQPLTDIILSFVESLGVIYRQTTKK